MSRESWLHSIGMPIAVEASRGYYLPGSDRDDVLQEASIALWQACETWDTAQGPFVPYARLVINRHLIDCVRTARRHKQDVLTSADRPELEGIGQTGDPTAETVEEREKIWALGRAIRELTESEHRTLGRILLELPYVSKADDQQRYRLRRKLKTAYHQGGSA